MSNEIDKRQRARTSSADLKAAAEATGIDLGHQLIGAITGLAEATRASHSITEQMLLVLNESILATRGLTDELAALRALLPPQPEQEAHQRPGSPHAEQGVHQLIHVLGSS